MEPCAVPIKIRSHRLTEADMAVLAFDDAIVADPTGWKDPKLHAAAGTLTRSCA